MDRIPVIIPGGMMAGTLYELVTASGLPYPGIHTDADHMVAYTRYLQENCNIDNTGVPFCMTVEAEDYGAEVDLGDVRHEPRIVKSPFRDLGAVLIHTPQACDRHQVTLEAITQLSENDVPVIGNIIGPMSLLTSLVEQGTVYRSMKQDPHLLKQVLAKLGESIADFATQQISAGADLIMMADPSAAGDIIGPAHFEQYLQPVYRSIIHRVQTRKRYFVLHICGRILNLVSCLKELTWNGLSVDSLVSLKQLDQKLDKRRVLMGNVSTHLMMDKDESVAYHRCRKIVETTAILSPACGLSTKTPTKNIRAMVKAAKDAAKGLDNSPSLIGKDEYN